MIKRNSSREEVENYITSHKSREEILCECYNCGKQFTKIKKNIQANLRIDNFKICCSQECSLEYKNRKEGKLLDVICECCGKEFTKTKSQIKEGHRNYCSRSCAAKINSLGRKRTEDSILKLKKSLRKHYESKGKSEIKYKPCKGCGEDFISSRDNILYCSISCAEKYGCHASKALRKTDRKINTKGHSCWVKFEECLECKKLITISSKRVSKYCSKECSTEYRRKRQSERLKLAENRVNLGRHKPSYMESSFSKWLDSFNIEYRFEPQFKNEELGKYYYPDFVFDDKMLIIELDGNQHEKTKEADAIRDEYIERVYGYSIVRIKHKEYVKKLRFKEICDLLGIPVIQ